MARPTALAPLGAVLRGIGATLENIGAGIADTSTREKRLRPARPLRCARLPALPPHPAEGSADQRAQHETPSPVCSCGEPGDVRYGAQTISRLLRGRGVS
jgi:hypothetical protein